MRTYKTKRQVHGCASATAAAAAATLAAALRDEAPPLELPDLLSTLLAYAPHIMAVFSGHYHR